MPSHLLVNMRAACNRYKLSHAIHSLCTPSPKNQPPNTPGVGQTWIYEVEVHVENATSNPSVSNMAGEVFVISTTNHSTSWNGLYYFNNHSRHDVIKVEVGGGGRGDGNRKERSEVGVKGGSRRNVHGRGAIRLTKGPKELKPLVQLWHREKFEGTRGCIQTLKKDIYRSASCFDLFMPSNQLLESRFLLT